MNFEIRLNMDNDAFTADSEGVFGVIGEYFDGSQWLEVDAVWGFVGDDWQTSGYDTDIMGATMEALASAKCCTNCKQMIGKST